MQLKEQKDFYTFGFINMEHNSVKEWTFCRGIFSKKICA